MDLKDRLDLTENMSPVGTNYKRVQPQREISQTDREEFWNKSQEEERVRLIEEKKRNNEKRAQVEKERQEREWRETKERDASVREREQQIIKLRESEKNAFNSLKSEPKPEANDDNERRQRSEQMRRQRAEEVKSVISQSSIRNTRALFEQNSSAGQMNAIRSSSQTKNNLISSRKEFFQSNESSAKPTPTPVPQKVVETKVFQSVSNGKQNETKNVIKTEPEVVSHRAAEVVSHREAQVVSPIAAEVISHREAQVVSPIAAQVVSHSSILSNETRNEFNNEVDSFGQTTNGRDQRPDETHLTESSDSDVIYTRNLLQETYLESHPLEDIAEEQTWDGMYH